MPITVTVSLNVAPLTDNTVAFANAAAWNAYFDALSGTAELTPITVTGYSPTAYTAATVPYDVTIDEDQMIFPTWASFKALEAAYINLATNYDLLRAELYAAGLLSAP